MNLALFPITALLLLLSGVGTPAHSADSRHAATALIKAILGSGDELPQRPGKALAPSRVRPQHPAAALHSQRITAALLIPVVSTRQGNLNREAYRTQFGSIEGAHQPHGPPNGSARALLG